MKKRKKAILSFAMVIPVFLMGSVLFKNDDKSITTILSKRSYAYLPTEAKEYIEKVYEDTGNVVRTEKNKKDNEPYLNPKYIEYLEMSDEEKAEVELIPDVYVLDYQVNESYSNSSLPSSYDLRNVDGKNYISAIKDQGSTEICWAFASIENVETLLMKERGQSYSDQFQKFSIRQMDYAASTDRFIESYTSWGAISCSPVESCNYYPWKNPDNGSRELGKGGNFYTSSILMANGLTLVDEAILPWTEEDHTFWPKDIFSYDKSLYEVDSTIQMPVINEDSAEEELINSYVSDIKKYMLQYGGPFVGTYSPKSTCGFDNTNGTKALKTDDCVNDPSNRDQGHAMQIIGWDDNYEYAYCDAGTKHYAVDDTRCTSGKMVHGKGAWIVKNSWGEESAEGNAYKYIYLTYDSTRLSIGFTTSISEMATRSWDNNYHSNPWIDNDISNGMASVSEQTKEFDTHNDKSEKIEKIKFVTASKNGKFTLSISTKDKEYNDIAVVNSMEAGIYTADLSDRNIVLDDSKFSVKIVGEQDAKFYNDSLSVFTSNVDTTPYVVTYSSKAYDPAKPLSEANPIYVTRNGSRWDLTVDTYLKNLPSNSNLTYRVQRNGVIATERNLGDFKKSVINDVGTASFQGSESSYSFNFNINEAYGKVYTFEVVYGDAVVDSFPIKFNRYSQDAYSKIKLYANNGTDSYYEHYCRDTELCSLKLDDIKSLYNNGHYITSWNTKADGTGTSYSVDERALIYNSDMKLYAQWSKDPLNVKFNFECRETDNCNGFVNSITANYNDVITFPENNFTKLGYNFSTWAVNDRDHYELKIYEQEKRSVSQLLRVLQLSYGKGYFVSDNVEIDVKAIWSNNTKTITFDSNGGTGDMKSMNVEPNAGDQSVSHRIKDNLFTKNGFVFAGWNTLADGTGTSYTDRQRITIMDDLTLYAQWKSNNNFVVNRYVYDREKGYISDIDANTTVEWYKQYIGGISKDNILVDYKIVNGQQVLYTGSKTTIYLSQNPSVVITNIVSGDTNGDGKVNYLDYVNVYNHIQKTKHPESNKKLLVDEYLIAADMSRDNKISYLDYVKIYNRIKELKGGF